MAFRLLLSKKNRDEMKERSRYITVNPDKSSGSDMDDLDMSKLSKRQLDTETSLKLVG